MGLGRTCCAAASVASGSAAEKNYHIACGRSLAADICGRGSANDCSQLHVFGNVSLVVDFIHDSGGKTDLVSVGTVAGGSGCRNLSLRKLAWKRL